MQLSSLEAQVASARRGDLPALRAKLWSAYDASPMAPEDDALATRLSDIIAARLADRAGPQPVDRMRRPRRPRWSTPERADRIRHRRRLAASGPLPPGIAQFFTVGELAVLRVVGDECRAHGRCDRTVGELADRAMVSKSLVKTAVAEAKRRGLLVVEVRKRTWNRHAPSVLTIVSAEWSTWLRKGGAARKETTLDKQELRKGLVKAGGGQGRGVSLGVRKTAIPPSGPASHTPPGLGTSMPSGCLPTTVTAPPVPRRPFRPFPSARRSPEVCR